MMTEKGVRDMLEVACSAAGGQRAWARFHDIDVGYVSRVLHGQKAPGESICKALGLEQVVHYRFLSAPPSKKEGEG